MAPAFLKNIDRLETNAINQLVVRQTLQTTRDDDIFAICDCAACPWPEKAATVPPRAQAAHQQATHLYKQLQRRLAGRLVNPWHYRDFGSLVALGKYSTVGSLMGKLVGRSLFIEGYFARFMYVSLYKMHEYELHGFIKVALDTVVRLITRRHMSNCIKYVWQSACWGPRTNISGQSEPCPKATPISPASPCCRWATPIAAPSTTWRAT